MQSLLLFTKLLIFTIYISQTEGQNMCSRGECVKKCCGPNKFLPYRKKLCTSYPGLNLNATVPVYNLSLSDTQMKLEDVFYLETASFKNKSFRINVYEATGIGFNFYLVQNGILHLELPNAYKRWTLRTPDKYCFDYILPPPNSTWKPRVGVWVSFADEGSGMVQGNSYFTAGMSISCVFMTLVLVVYAILPELRNLGGLVLMAYVFSLLCAFIFLMVMQAKNHSTMTCKCLSFTVYFFLLSSFFWMNIMSCDIWWTFRGYAKARPIHRRGERFKFGMYCIYAWGVPLLMAVGLLVVNEINLRHIPAFITPKIPEQGCFIEGGEKLVYLYIPMVILVVVNWVFFLMTAFNIWRLSRGTAVLDSAAAGNPAAHRTQMHRFLIYLKLSILMGLNWLLEVVSFFKPDLSIWWFTDAYNLLIGLAIFLIFVCKKKIFDKLRKKLLHRQSTWNQSIKSRSSRSSSTTESCNLNSSQDTQPQVCNSPRGPVLPQNSNGYTTVSF